MSFQTSLIRRVCQKEIEGSRTQKCESIFVYLNLAGHLVRLLIDNPKAVSKVSLF